eukprot:15109719-Ditylum_brightwellii.AAC.1
MKTFGEDEKFAKTLGKNFIFKYQMKLDMDEFRVEVQKFILRFAYITSKCDDRNEVVQKIKEEKDEIGTLSCKEHLTLQGELGKFDDQIKGSHKHLSTIKQVTCQGVVYGVKHNEVKRSKATEKASKERAKGRTPRTKYTYGTDLHGYVA